VTPGLVRDLGYRELRVTVDVAKRLVRTIDYRDSAGKPLKQYRVEETEAKGGRWFPSEVRLEHLANGTITSIGYEYWLPTTPPPEALFAPSVDEEAFRPRIVRYLDSLGLGDRIRAELAASDARVLEWEKRWGVKTEPPAK
jgi:hypothetical protein